MRGRSVLLWLTFGSAAVMLAHGWRSSSEGTSSMSTATATPEGSATRARWTELPQRDGLGQQVADMFSPPSSMSAAAGGTAPKVEAAPAPAAPTVPYRVAGRVRLEDKQHIVLAKDNDVVIAREGDRLDQGYRVESIRPDYVTLLFRRSGRATSFLWSSIPSFSSSART